MKSNRNKTKKILAGLVAFVLIGAILFFANAFVGNPISRMLANRTAKEYVEENYRDLDLEIEKAYYSFKDGNYHVRAKSNTSIDTHFEMDFTSVGKLHYDNYEDVVKSKWNTLLRIDDEYRKLAGSVFKDDFPYETSIDYGELLDKSEDFSYLELDKIYDVKELAKKQGHLVFYIETENQDKDTMVKALLDTKKSFDRKEVSFHSIDLTLEKSKEEGIKYEEGLMVKDFLYEDIYLDGLTDRVEKNIEETREYYEKEDEKIRRHEKEI